MHLLKSKNEDVNTMTVEKFTKKMSEENQPLPQTIMKCRLPLNFSANSLKTTA